MARNRVRVMHRAQHEGLGVKSSGRCAPGALAIPLPWRRPARRESRGRASGRSPGMLVRFGAYDCDRLSLRPANKRAGHPAVVGNRLNVFARRDLQLQRSNFQAHVRPRLEPTDYVSRKKTLLKAAADFAMNSRRFISFPTLTVCSRSYPLDGVSSRIVCPQLPLRSNDRWPRSLLRRHRS